ncbi:MAG: C40 family peptidase [Chitinophagales bacterium]|nr:C40 family peptidase [Chitinophagales bacterium]MCZ2394628.1 C40 family peptidase [Chitinophagales bacterium]
MKSTFIILIYLSQLFVISIHAQEKIDLVWFSKYQGQQIADFASKFEGVRYDYADSDPLRGFDCSGYVNFVFSYFNIKVPRTTSQFANIGQSIPLSQIQAGDILLFKGSNTNSSSIGHMGIVSEIKQGKIYFLHAATSNNRGIMTSGLDENYFKIRFVKAIRISYPF